MLIDVFVVCNVTIGNKQLWLSKVIVKRRNRFKDLSIFDTVVRTTN